MIFLVQRRVLFFAEMVGLFSSLFDGEAGRGVYGVV